jgi:hypothetical protein
MKHGHVGVIQNEIKIKIVKLMLEMIITLREISILSPGISIKIQINLIDSLEFFLIRFFIYNL